MRPALHNARGIQRQGQALRDARSKLRGIIEKTSADFEIDGTKTLYKVIAIREYDENGNLVAIGSESSPLASGHSLKPTYDWVRAHT